jgi:flagellar motility protein MotE (MotC chaperone)
LKSLLKRLRLLPFVMAVGASLLLVKGAGLVMVARAQDAGATPPPAATATATPDPSSDPAADDAETASAGEVDVLTSLAKRRAELDKRAQDITTESNLIAAAEKRVDDKIAALKALETQMQTLLGQRDAAEQAQLTALVKTYSSMKPKDAARIFNSLDDDVLLSVAQAMKPDVLGAILAAMQPDAAQKLTVKLANRLKPPAPAAPPPQQLASLTPPTATAATPAAMPQSTPPIAAPTPAPIATPAKAVPAPQQTASNTPPQSPANTAPSASTSKPASTAPPSAAPASAAAAPPAAKK